jgi:hypothetical protein
VVVLPVLRGLPARLRALISENLSLLLLLLTVVSLILHPVELFLQAPDPLRFLGILFLHLDFLLDSKFQANGQLVVFIR